MIKLPKLRELKEAVKSLFSKPYTSKFPDQPHIAHANFRGQPKFDQEKCVGCLACQQVCPVNAINHLDITDDPDNPKRIMIHYTDTCIFCGQCEANCIANKQGIKLSTDWELSFFNRAAAKETIEKELQLCEICNDVIACKDHLNWISDKIGELTYSSPTLYLSKLKKLGIVDQNLINAAKDFSRADRIKIVCSKCRRDTTLPIKK